MRRLSTSKASCSSTGSLRRIASRSRVLEKVWVGAVRAGAASVKAQVCDYCEVLAATSPRCVVDVAIGVGLLSLRIGLWQRCKNEVDFKAS